ncbi:MAG TPA: hypothetical protein VIY49_38140 [Bryobacteraceae bacterium]
MNGYLQRLASNARNPGGIHPLVGSLYSRPEPESLPPLMEEQVVAPPASQPRERLFAPLIEPLIKETTEEAPIDATEDTAAGPPSRSLGATQPAATGNIAGEPTLAGTTPPLTGSSQLPKPKLTAPKKPHSTFHLEPLLLPPDEPRPGAVAEFAPRFTAAHPGPAPYPELIKPGSHDDARVSGEIQIHIGRIEVTAVPPPLPRPTAPPARKSINLGEYLKRGRGSSS